jgi:hypothetical protein
MSTLTDLQILGELGWTAQVIYEVRPSGEDENELSSNRQDVAEPTPSPSSAYSFLDLSLLSGVLLTAM